MPDVLFKMSDRQREVFFESISRVADAVKPEAIICYGSRKTNREAWSAFNQTPTLYSQVHYDILIITRSGERCKDHEVFDKVNQLNSEAIRLIPVVHPLKSVQEAIQKGSRFFTTVCRKGVLVYGDTKPDVGFESVETCQYDQSHWIHHFGLAKQFLHGAEYYLSNSQSSLSVFMLHQATEHACIATIHARLGYRSATHSLSRLLALTENISPELSGLFPRHTEAERELFSLLAHAYSDVRYRQTYTISLEHAKTLLERVKELTGITENIYNEVQNQNEDYRYRFNQETDEIIS
jgi:HEPN domain-containing protein